MPWYERFLKSILLNKRKLEEFETVAPSEEYSVILQNKLTSKLKDLGSYSIPCLVGNKSFNKALCNLQASISLVLLLIYKRLDIEELKPTTMTLQVTDRSIKYSNGVLENVPIRVGKFYVLVKKWRKTLMSP